MNEHDIDDHDLGADPLDPAKVPQGGDALCPECAGVGALPDGEACPVCDGTGKATGRLGGG